jgi:integrase
MKIFNMTKSDMSAMETAVRNATKTTDFVDPGFGDKADFGNLTRYAIGRKIRAGVSITANGPIWRRVLSDCASWPVEPTKFKQMLDRYLSGMECEISDKTGKRLSNQYYNQFISVVRSVWHYAVQLDIVEANPISAARFPAKKTVPRKRTLTETEIQDISREIKGRHEGLYWAFLFCVKNPIGYGDVRRLKCSDCDLINRTIRYSRKKTGAGACPIIYAEIQEYVTVRCASGEALLFDLPADYRFTFNAACNAAGVHDLSWHDLRHHAATWLAKKGVPLHIIASLGGWSSQAMVERYHDLKSDSAASFAKTMLI